MDMLKDLSKRGRNGSGYVGPMLTVGKMMVTKDGEGVGSGDPEVMVGEDGVDEVDEVDEDGCSPLERVASRQGEAV
jgi:hypothetical protein